jgi:glycosyltransferase involved in cell wall biosynthesis
VTFRKCALKRKETAELQRALTISVIIPTKNRPADLTLTVKTLFQQTVLPRELIIIDQSASDESRCRIDQVFSDGILEIQSRVRLRYVHDSSLPGLTWARNRAMKIADGDIWLFLDDDVSLDQNFLAEILAAYEQHPQFDGVSGIVTNYRLPPLAYRSWSRIFFRGPFDDERQSIYWNAPRLGGAAPVLVNKLGGGLMSFRAQAVRGMRFDENLRGVCDGEDIDFCARMKPGTMLAIAPAARLVHNASPVGRSQEHWLERTTQANCYLFHRNWNTTLINRACYEWLMFGLGIVAVFASLRRLSLTPWNTFRGAAREGLRLTGTNTRIFVSGKESV